MQLVNSKGPNSRASRSHLLSQYSYESYWSKL